VYITGLPDLILSWQSREVKIKPAAPGRAFWTVWLKSEDGSVLRRKMSLGTIFSSPKEAM
jgi:hypothetical protein